MNTKHFYGSLAKPKEVFGDGTPEFHAFHEANRTVAPGASELLDILLDSADPEALRYSFTLPDGFEVDFPTKFARDVRIEIDELDHASIAYRYDVNVSLNTAIDLGCTKDGNLVKSDPSIAANTIHAVDAMIVREMCRRCNYDPERLRIIKEIIEQALQLPEAFFTGTHRIDALAHDSGFHSLVAAEYITGDTVYEFSVEFLHQLLELIERTLNRPSFELICIHDDFKAHANYINWVRQTYVDIMAEIADSTMLEFLLTQIRGRNITVNKHSATLGSLIREAEYALS